MPSSHEMKRISKTLRFPFIPLRNFSNSFHEGYHIIMKQQLINGQWCNASNGKTWDVINPATEEVIATVPFGDDKDCNEAIDAASNAFRSWSSSSSWTRAAILKKT